MGNKNITSAKSFNSKEFEAFDLMLRQLGKFGAIGMEYKSWKLEVLHKVFSQKFKYAKYNLIIRDGYMRIEVLQTTSIKGVNKGYF